MRLSTRTRYGARALAELAAAPGDAAVPVAALAERQRLSPKYLEQIMAALKAAGLVRAERGRDGGYALARPAGEITLADLYRALEGPVAPAPCLEGPDRCPMRDSCPTQEVWAEVGDAVREVLEATTVLDLAEKVRDLQGAGPHV
jgi:Rrf2 family protein